jgi:replicative DNA helicase
MSVDFLEKSMPASLDAERAILGAILLDSDVCNQAIELLRRDDFFLDSHRRIYSAMTALCEQRRPIDYVTLSELLRLSGEFEQVGGASYIASLIDGVPRTDDISHYARIVRMKAARRSLINGCHGIIADAFDSDDDGALIEKAERVVFEASQGREKKQFEAAGDIVHRCLIRAERVASGEIPPGLETGFYDLDYMLCGLQPADQVVIAARPSMGKTSFALCLARNVALAGVPVGIFELEMSSGELGNRLLSIEAHVELRKIRMPLTMTKEDWIRLDDARRRIAEMPLHLDDSAGLTISEIRSKARRGLAKQKFGLLIVDYMGLAKADGRVESRNAEVGAISRAMKGLAKELQIPVIALSQLSRASEQRADKEPQLSDLRDSGEIEQNADAVIFIHRDEYYEPGVNPGMARLLIRKQRNGQTGEVEIAFDGDYTAFRNLAH